MKAVVVAGLAVAGLVVAPAGPAGAVELHAPHAGTSVECGGPVLWHFVHNQVAKGTTTTGTITARFDTGTEVVAADKVLRTVRHYDVVTDAGATLFSASDDIREGGLVLSHTDCLGGPPTACVAGDSVTVTWPGVELGHPGVGGLVQEASTSLSLLPGQYQVTLTSGDVLHAPGFQPEQTREQWFVRLLADGTEVARTGAIGDLPTEDTQLTQAVGTVTLTAPVTEAVATHLLAGDPVNTWGAESVEPTSATFVCL